MKKILLFIALITVLFANISKAQWPCVPDPKLTYVGVFPDELPEAMAGYLYWSTISLKIPKDSIISTVPVTIDSAHLIGIFGAPSGFKINCDKPGCTWMGGDKGCVLFSGEVDKNFVDSTTEYKIAIFTITYARFTGGTTQFSQIDSNTTYKFRLRKYNGMGEISKYTTLTSYPNPTQAEINIEVRDIESNGNELRVTDMVGKTVFAENFDKPNQFLTTYKVDLSNHQKGIYFITLKSGGKTSTTKVILQ